MFKPRCTFKEQNKCYRNLEKIKIIEKTKTIKLR